MSSFNSVNYLSGKHGKHTIIEAREYKIGGRIRKLRRLQPSAPAMTETVQFRSNEDISKNFNVGRFPLCLMEKCK